MKKYILILAAAAVTGGVSAQKNKVVSAYNYDKAFQRSGKCKELVSGVEAINMAIENDQTKSWAKTWYYRGNLYFNMIASKDPECKKIDADALDKCTDSYLKALVLNFDDPELKKLDLEKEDGSDLMRFFGALQERPKMDDETYTATIMGRKLPGLAGEYANQGITKFSNKDYKGAQEDFGKSMMLSQMTGRLDTMLMYNTALASEYAGDYETAKQVYDGLIMMKYNVDGAGPDLYKSMFKIYKKEEDNVKAAEYIAKGRKAYPDDNSLLVLELEGFLQSGNNDEALANLNTGITNDPSNAVLYFARGTVYENLKDKYELLWDIPSNDGYLQLCAIMQKFVDQTISANTNYDPSRYEGNKVPMKLLLKDLLTTYKLGVKTLYYHNTRDGASDTSALDAKASEPMPRQEEVVVEEDDDCAGGACKI